MSPDLVLAGGTVIDGTGAPARRADVIVRNGTIADIGFFDIGPETTVIDATGLSVAPGFIDIHSHSDYTLLVDPRAVSAVTQGVTLEVVGNCGYGCAPIIAPGLAGMAIYGALQGRTLPACTTADYLARLDAVRPAVNVMTLVPNGQLRLGHVGVQPVSATPAQLGQMQASLRQSLEEGAIGYSTGLEYAQEIGATPAEIGALCRVAANL